MSSRDATSSASDQAPAGLTLTDYVALVWRFKVVLVAAAIVAGGATFVRSMSGPRVYESTVTFAVTPSKIGEGGQAVGGTSAYRPMVESLTTAAAVIREVGLDKPPTSMRPWALLEQVMSVSEVRGTNLMKVTVVYPDPTLAATIANSVADRAVKANRTVSSAEALYARDMIKVQLDLAKGRFDQADRALRTYRQEAQIEALKKDVEAMLGQRANTLPLLVSIETEKARLSRFDQELAKRDRIDIMKRTIDSEPVLAEASRARSQQNVEILGMQLRSETINEVYQQLDALAANSRANLAALEKQKTELLDARKINANELPLLTRLYEREAEFARLQVERDLAEKIYVDLSQRYEVAHLQVVGRSAELQIIDPAVPADRPVSRQVARNTVVGSVAGFCIALAAVLLWQAALVARQRRVPGL